MSFLLRGEIGQAENLRVLATVAHSYEPRRVDFGVSEPRRGREDTRPGGRGSMSGEYVTHEIHLISIEQKRRTCLENRCDCDSAPPGLRLFSPHFQDLS